MDADIQAALDELEAYKRGELEILDSMKMTFRVKEREDEQSEGACF